MSKQNSPIHQRPELQPGQSLIGVHEVDGQLDFSRAAVVINLGGLGLKERAGSVSGSSGQPGVTAAETAEQKVSPLDAAREKAQEAGLDETTLTRLVRKLEMDDKPWPQRLTLAHIAKRLPNGATPQEIWKIATDYEKARIRDTEKGELLHYHQTSVDNFESIVKQGGLLSHNTQKELGIAGSSAGSRPDVVQFTRDHYDQNGNLTKAGLEATNRIGVARGIALVFEESIMDDPDYNGIVHYPNAPEAPLSKLKAVAVAEEGDLDHVRQVLAQKNVPAEVVTRNQWDERQAAQKAS